jgi:rsbT co-antagonist protein RsbR
MNDSLVEGPGGELGHAVEAEVEEVLALLRGVAAGDLTGRLSPRYPDSHPVGALALSMNAMIDALADARSKAEAHHRELADRIAVVETQRSAIRELSTPIIEVWDRVLCLPIVGMLDSSRAAEMTTGLLAAVVAKKAAFAIIDITGIHVMDTGTTDHFLRMARSVRLLGAQCILSGVNPEVALTVVRMGTEFSPLRSHRNVRDALRYCVRAIAAERDRLRLDKRPRGSEGGPT